MDYQQLAGELVAKARRKGADQAEVYIETSRNLSVEVRNGEIETVQEAAGFGAGFRVFVGGRMAFSSSNDLQEAALEKALDQAIAFARITTPDPSNVLPETKDITPVEGLYDPEVAATPLETKIELAKKVEALAMKDPRITVSDGAGYGEGEGEVFLANSHGLLKSYKSSECGYGVSVVAEKGDQKSSGGESSSCRFYADLKKPEEIAAKAAREAYERLDPRPLKTQRAAVIFSSDVARSLLGGVLAAVNGERVLQGASFLGDKLGQKVASPLMTLVDDGTRPRGLASAPFDGEGVPTEKRMILEKGVLRGYLYNTIVARRAGVSSTGNASRGGSTVCPGSDRTISSWRPGTRLRRRSSSPRKRAFF